ncbi:glycerophosphoryl diester phosphodiesterase [Nitrosospira multiformis ATCC 25196]|uniref:Glycerophosphoryl diester phosphodiesterase n=1 Tax=Nitrosospira multiformis (strain ATCC 25196 / NCIMB 11849 / C 71) TaxID=323848 RepID=Q2Y787_NITMU|nr:glycerophosphodiester phosphodiesterase [Nitrosospira multiformis]ABB75384.1 Glycerophosphoryl diester phosphodiesterase [Nitrosospira multiformis ATCC 25196]SEG05890.1 glycerophosphoryl diester phosphodiesterase [Nitrosospira multiformis ATCC 25196]
MLVLAHRGYHVTAPENTLEAFDAAIMAGVNGIETDVRMSRDGVPVLVHDRVMATGQAVSDLAHCEIEDVLGHKIPTLDEALAHFPDILWNIELKTPHRLSTVFGVLEKYQACHRIIVSSFRHDLIAICASSLKLDCGLLVAHRPQTLDSLWAGFDCEGNARINHLVWDYNVLDQAMLAQAAARGFRNFVYGPVTRAEHEECRQLGVDGVITDYPLLAQGV